MPLVRVSNGGSLQFVLASGITQTIWGTPAAYSGFEIGKMYIGLNARDNTSAVTLSGAKLLGQTNSISVYGCCSRAFVFEATSTTVTVNNGAFHNQFSFLLIEQ